MPGQPDIALNHGITHVDVVILVALRVEADAVIDALGNCSRHHWQSQDLHIGEVAGQSVLVHLVGRMGSGAAAQAAERMIRAWKPDRLILAGIAGGVKGASTDLRSGDVLVPDQIVGYELAKVTGQATARRYEVYRTDAALLHCARSLQPADWADAIVMPRPDDPAGRIRPVVHVGPMLTGDKVIADRGTVEELLQAWPRAIGLEMESLGVALAAHENNVGFLVVKAVSDFADHAKSDDWHRYAATAAARFVRAVLVRACVVTPGPGHAHEAPHAPPPPEPDQRPSESPSQTNNFYEAVHARHIGIYNEARPKDQR